MVWCIQAWLSNWLTLLTFDGVGSWTVTLKQGVPQGSVLSPLLLIFYIDDLASAVGAPQVNLFADHVAVWTQDTDLERVRSKLQKGLDTVTSWSTYRKMKLSAKKSECSFFTTNTHEAKWLPALYLSRQQIKYNPNPKLLGIAYDRQLTFGLHASIVVSKMKQEAGALRCLAPTDGGHEKYILWSTCIATERSNVEYAAAAWLPWVSISMMEKLEMCQKYAGRAIIRQIKTPPCQSNFSRSWPPNCCYQGHTTQHHSHGEVSLNDWYQSEKVDSHSRSPPAHKDDKLEKESLRGLEIYHWVYTTR